jgi:hypothetical protein
MPAPVTIIGPITDAVIDLDKLADFKRRARFAMIDKQKKSFEADHPFYETAAACWAAEMPYTGAIGGALTFEITDTSLGTIVKVRCDYVAMVEDITRYEDW